VEVCFKQWLLSVGGGAMHFKRVRISMCISSRAQPNGDP
jgi:hypothetical protein